MDKLNYLTEEESRMPLDMALMQLVLGLESCKTKEDAADVLKDAYTIGYRQALEDNHILYGEDAKKFIEAVENPPPLTKKQKKFLESCTDLFNKTKIESWEGDTNGKTDEKANRTEMP